MQAHARSALLLSVVPLGSYLAPRISSLLMNLCGRLVVNGFKKDQHANRRRLRDTFTHAVYMKDYAVKFLLRRLCRNMERLKEYIIRLRLRMHATL